MVKSFLKDRGREHFIGVFLDNKNHPVFINICQIGSMNASIAIPHEITKSAILSSPASIMVAHNHPSCETTESREDMEVNKLLAEAGKLMGIELSNHLIIGDGKNTLRALQEVITDKINSNFNISENVKQRKILPYCL